MTGEFSVYQFFPDGSYVDELRFVDAKTAVEKAYRISRSPGAMLGITKRVIITDEGDHTVFEWKHGEGVTFPTLQMREKSHEQDSDQ